MYWYGPESLLPAKTSAHASSVVGLRVQENVTKKGIKISHYQYETWTDENKVQKTMCYLLIRMPQVNGGCGYACTHPNMVIVICTIVT